MPRLFVPLLSLKTRLFARVKNEATTRAKLKKEKIPMYCGEDDVAAFVQTTTANPTTLPSSPETLLSAVSYNLQHRSPASSLRLLPGRLQTDLYSCCSSGRSLLCLRSKGRRIPVNLSSPTHLTNHFCFLTSSSITSVPYHDCVQVLLLLHYFVSTSDESPSRRPKLCRGR